MYVLAKGFQIIQHLVYDSLECGTSVFESETHYIPLVESGLSDEGCHLFRDVILSFLPLGFENNRLSSQDW